MQPIFNLINQVEGYFDQLVFACVLAFSISTALSALCYVLSIIYVVVDFRKKTLELRRGKWSFPAPRSDFNVNEAVNFVGAFISNAVLGFFTILILYGLFLTPLCYSLFWVLLYMNLKTILIFVAPAVAQSVLFTIFKQIFSTQHFITWRLYDILLN